MNSKTATELRDFLDEYMRRTYGRLLERCFQGTITAVTAKPTLANNEAGTQYLCSIQRNGETSSDGMTYLCVTPGYKPVVGDVVEVMWRDEHTAYVLWPTNGTTPASASYASQIIAGTQMSVSPSSGVGAVTVNWNDPTTHVGDLIVRDQLGLDRLPASSVIGNVLQIKSLGNFAVEMGKLAPYLWYRLNEAAGPTMADSSLSAAHGGTYNSSGVTYHVSPATGDGDYAVTFDGTNGYGHVGADPTGTGDLSIALFVKGTSTTYGEIACGNFSGNFGNPPATYQWAFMPFGRDSTTGNTPSFYVNRQGSGFQSVVYAPGVNLHDNNWHLVVIKRALSTGLVTMYVDGSPVTTQNATGGTYEGTGSVIYAGTAINGGLDLYLGGGTLGPGANFDGFPGSMDEFAFFQRLLSDSEVSTLWSNVAGPAAVLPAWGPSSGIPASLGVAEGDILYYHNGAWTRLPIGGANSVLHGGTDPSYSAVVESDISLSDVSTDNASTSAHGFLPKLPGSASVYLDGTGAFSTPPSGGGGAHVHAVNEQMTGDGVTTVFYLANEAEDGAAQSTVAAYVNGSRTDCTLSSDGAKITFASAPAAAAAIRVDYLAVLGS